MHKEPTDPVALQFPAGETLRLLAWVWMGIVIGVSFLATPVKFTADSITRAVALDVGRATFQALGYLEWALTILLAIVIWRAVATGQRPSDRTLVAAAIISGVVVLQALWLVPALDERVASIIAGIEPPPSHLHTFYGVAEVVKVAALGLLGFWTADASTTERSTLSTSELSA